MGEEEEDDKKDATSIATAAKIISGTTCLIK